MVRRLRCGGGGRIFSYAEEENARCDETPFCAAEFTMSREKGSRLSLLLRASSNRSVRRKLLRNEEIVGFENHTVESRNEVRKMWRIADSDCMTVFPDHTPLDLAQAAKDTMNSTVS